MSTNKMRLDSELLRDPGRAVAFEWIETNGNGAYAMSTPIFCNTRKYHSLLCVHPEAVDDPYVLLSHYDIELEIGQKSYRLSTNHYPAVLHPRGYELAGRFELDLYPMLSYDIDGMTLSIGLVMPYGLDATILSFELSCDDRFDASTDGIIRLRPFLAYRRHHALVDENTTAQLSVEAVGEGHRVTPYEGLPGITITASSPAEFQPGADWYRCFIYPRERERGYDHEEDLMTPGVFSIPVSVGKPVYAAASIKPMRSTDLGKQFAAEVKRRKAERKRLNELAKVSVAAKYRKAFTVLAEQSRHFLVTEKRAASPSILAGFPWFGAWGRDAMICLEGITLDLGKYEEALSVLETFARFERDGLFPNQLSINGQASYNTIDASLWFFHAVERYLATTGETERVRVKLFPTMERILSAYFEQRVPDASIRNGLLSAGSPDTQLTWMDAMVDGAPVTPRHGFPVEIQALWYAALRFFSDVSDHTHPLRSRVSEAIDAIEARFLDLFWIEEGYLADVVSTGGERDLSIRPNQIIAVSLSCSLLDDSHAKALLSTVEEHLLTPFGLRTLAPGSPGYTVRYRGSQANRDRAYHQGTVWPWPIGHFCAAFARYFADEPKRIKRIESVLKPLFDEHPYLAGLGSISEVFDASAPHDCGGCPMQAWSVSGVIHALLSFRKVS